MPRKRYRPAVRRLRNTALILSAHVSLGLPRFLLPGGLHVSRVTWHKFERKDSKTFIVDKKNQLDVTFVFFISLILVAQHVSGNHVPIIRS